MTIKSILIAADELRKIGAQGALIAIGGGAIAEELGLEDGAPIEWGRRVTWFRLDHDVPEGQVLVATMFPDPREAVRHHAASAAERR